MKFEKNTAVTILRPLFGEPPRIVRGWTDQPLPEGFGGTTIGAVLAPFDEGIYWARGHDDEAAKALLVARALR